MLKELGDEYFFKDEYEQLRIQDEIEDERMDEIIIYTSIDCPKCKILKARLKVDGIPFTSVNIDDTEVMSKLVMENVYIMSAPALKVGDKFFLESDIFDGDGKLKDQVLDEINKNVGGKDN